MKKYIEPKIKVVNLNLTGSILEGETIGGQSYNPVTNPEDPKDIDWSAKGQGLFGKDNEDEGWGKSSSPWD